jgi:DNA-3-methyladenine glycosylase
MAGSVILKPDFFLAPAADVALRLLGARLVRKLGGVQVSGIITEAEGYQGEEDLACHARHGRTRRTQIMYGPPGRAYVYFTYGMHWMLNVVTGGEDKPAAVLVRALRPGAGLEEIASRRRGVPVEHWCDGPAKLCQAFAIDGKLNGVDLTDPAGGLWLEQGEIISPDTITAGPRVGLGNTPEPWLSIPWRFRTRE